MSDEPPLESLLPQEAVTKIRAILAEILSKQPPPQALIGGKATLSATGQVIHLQGIATAEAFGSATLQIFDPAVSKHLWESPSAWDILQFISAILFFFYTQYSEHVTAADSEKFMRTILKEAEEFWIAQKEQPKPTPKPAPDARGAKKHRSRHIKRD